jgi:hypothetical protein
MARIGLYPALIVVVFGIVAPFFIFQIWPLDRVCASPLPGLCPRPWLRRGESGISLGCERNPRKCRLHGGSALILAVYAAVSFSAGALIDKTIESFRRE